MASKTTTISPAGTIPEENLAKVAVRKKLLIWAGFLLLVYLARDFFFTAFMTFLLCYLTLSVVGWTMRRLSPSESRPGLRRLITVAFIVLIPLGLVAGGMLVAPRILDQGQHLAGWMSQVTPETEATRLLEDLVGPYLFEQRYPNSSGENYREDLEAFRTRGIGHVDAYNQFPNLEAWAEAGFSGRYTEQERLRILARLQGEGTSSKEFEQWFSNEKYPELKELGRKQTGSSGRVAGSADALVRAAASASPEQLLDQIRHDPAVLLALKNEWTQATLDRELAAVKGSPAYKKQFRESYETRRKESPGAIPYTYEQYAELKKVRPQGPQAFGQAMEKFFPTPEGEADTKSRADFEAEKKHELFRQWWSTNAAAQFLRQQLHSSISESSTGWLERALFSFLNIPVDLATALILSIFICIDFPNLRVAFRRLRQTWLREVYDEIVPALFNLGHLIGRSMYAQGVIAACNAIMILIGLSLLGVEHEILLSIAVFILCLVPTVGAMLSLVLIVAFTLVQPGGGVILALKAAGLVAFVICVESVVLSPRILGRMMELHPVLIIAILPLAQYFFGVWGLILATPVAVYVIHVIILGRGLPGSGSTSEAATTSAGKAGDEKSAPEVPSVTPRPE